MCQIFPFQVVGVPCMYGFGSPTPLVKFKKNICRLWRRDTYSSTCSSSSWTRSQPWRITERWSFSSRLSSHPFFLLIKLYKDTVSRGGYHNVFRSFRITVAFFTANYVYTLCADGFQRPFCSFWVFLGLIFCLVLWNYVPVLSIKILLKALNIFFTSLWLVSYRIFYCTSIP